MTAPKKDMKGQLSQLQWKHGMLIKLFLKRIQSQPQKNQSHLCFQMNELSDYISVLERRVKTNAGQILLAEVKWIDTRSYLIRREMEIFSPPAAAPIATRT